MPDGLRIKHLHDIESMVRSYGGFAYWHMASLVCSNTLA